MKLRGKKLKNVIKAYDNLSYGMVVEDNSGHWFIYGSPWQFKDDEWSFIEFFSNHKYSMREMEFPLTIRGKQH